MYRIMISGMACKTCSSTISTIIISIIYKPRTSMTANVTTSLRPTSKTHIRRATSARFIIKFFYSLLY